MIAPPISGAAACTIEVTMETAPSWSRSAANVSDIWRLVSENCVTWGSVPVGSISLASTARW